MIHPILSFQASLDCACWWALPRHNTQSEKTYAFARLVQGDDFDVSGEPVDLVWMRNELESKLEINTTILVVEPGMSKEVKILN